MRDLKQHEQLELEVLKLLSDHGFLNALVFGGGTCLRLCFGLDRYSIDLDFWQRNVIPKNYFKRMGAVLGGIYALTDFHEKHFSYLAELKSPNYPRKIKLEIRKMSQLKKNSPETELGIAFSPFSMWQVRLNTFTLKQMWKNKVDALLERKEIRDAYDLEFIYKKGAADLTGLSMSERTAMLSILDSFKPIDFKVTLGSLLEFKERDYYTTNGFKILKQALV